MILQIDDWKFDIDMERTMEHSSNEAAEHCDCAYCRNFYATIDTCHPDLRPFLAQFGLDVEAPDEMDTDVYRYDQIDYEPAYIVFGRIVQAGTSAITVGLLSILVEKPHKGSYLWDVVPKEADCFSLRIPYFSVPWILDESIEDVVSPANEPTFLQKMWNKILNRSPKNKTMS